MGVRNPLHIGDLPQIFGAIKTVVVAGAAANTNIAVAGIEQEDTLISVVELTGPGEAAGQAAGNNRTAQASITSSGNIQVSVATNTSADRRLVVQYFDKSAIPRV